MANYVGIHLGQKQVRILEAEGSAKKLKIIRFKSVDFGSPSEGPASSFMEKEEAAIVAKAFAEGNFSREPVAMSWDSGLTIFRELDLPFTTDDQIQKVIKYEAESHLLNFDIDDVVVSFYRHFEENNKSHLMVMAVRKDQLLNRFERLGDAGVDPLMADLDVMATFNALSGLGITKEHKSFLVLDCGPQTTNMLLISDGRLAAVRAIRVGSDAVTARLAQDLGEDAAQLADQTAGLLQNPNASPDDLLIPASSGEEKEETEKPPAELAHDMATTRADDYYLKISKEVRRSLVTARLTDPVEVIYVTGSGSRMPGFTETIVEKIGLDAPIEPLRILDRVECDLDPVEAEAVESELCTSLGLAFKLAGHDESGVDFRQEECRYARKFDQVKEPAIYLSLFLFVLVAIWNLFDIKHLSVKEPFLLNTGTADLARIHEQAAKKYKNVMGKDLPGPLQEPTYASLVGISRLLANEVNSLKATLGRGGAIPTMPSVFTYWRDCFQVLEDHRVAGKMDLGEGLDSNGNELLGKLVLKSLEIKVEGKPRPILDMVGETRSLSQVDTLVAALAKMPGLEEGAVVVDKAEARGSDRTSFSLTVTYPLRKEEYDR